MTRDIPEFLQAALCLYAPVMKELDDKFSPRGGITTFIGRDNPTALPVDAGGSAHGNTLFERTAERLLLPLVSDTYALIESCCTIKSQREPLSLISRGYVGNNREGPLVMQATITDGLGGIYAKRVACVMKSDILLVYTPEIHVQTTIGFPGANNDKLLTPLKEAMREGFAEGLRFAVENGLVLNMRNKRKDYILSWLDEFAIEGEAKLDATVGVFRFWTQSPGSSFKFVALNKDAWERNQDNPLIRNLGNDGVPFELVDEGPIPSSSSGASFH